MFKVCVEFVTILLLLYILAVWTRGMWDLSPALPQSGMQPTLFAREGGDLATGPQGNPASCLSISRTLSQSFRMFVTSGECYGLNIRVLPNSHLAALTLRVAVFGDGGSGSN